VMLGRRISAEILRDAGLVYRATPEVLARAAISPRAGVAITGGTYSVRFEAHPSVRRTRDEARRNPVNKRHHGHDGRPGRTSIETGGDQPGGWPSMSSRDRRRSGDLPLYRFAILRAQLCDRRSEL
jgi:hypothetical protein